MKQTKILEELNQSKRFEGGLVLKPVESGAINKSYLLENQEKLFFLKTFEMNHYTPVDREALFFMQRRLAEFNKAPRPSYLSYRHDFQVEQWVEHKSLANADMDKQEKIRFLAKTLHEIHQLPVYAITIDLPADWRAYITMADIIPDQELQDKLTRYGEIWRASHQHDQVLCHNDLAMEHISVTEPAVVFDWEYAACGSRYFDIAACAEINKLSEQENLDLQRNYAEISQIPLQDVIDQTTEQIPLVKLTNELWYLAAHIERPEA